MATKTKTKTEPKPGRMQLPPKIGKPQSTSAILLVKRNIRCNGQIHEIGLTSKGQLWIPKHTKEELEKYIMMGDLGNNPCKCAVILDAWRNNRMTDTQLHSEFRRERIVSSRLARRLLKHLNKYRHWPDIDIIYDELLEPYKEDATSSGYCRSHNALSCMATFVTGTIYKTLIHRGWRKELFSYEPGNHDIDIDKLVSGIGNQHSQHFVYDGDHTLFYAHTSGHGCISPHIGCTLVSDSPIHENTKPEDIPWRTLIDETEARLIYLLVHYKGDGQLRNRKKSFEEIADKHVAMMVPLPKHSKITIQEDRGTLTLRIEHPGLTVQAANRLAKHYRDTEDKVKRLLQHNRKRRELWYRTPSKPSRGLGSLKRVDEANSGMADRSVEGEAYGTGVD